METIEKIFELLEYRNVYLSRRLSAKKVARMANIRRKEIDRLLYDYFGISLKHLIMLYRRQSIVR